MIYLLLFLGVCFGIVLLLSLQAFLASREFSDKIDAKKVMYLAYDKNEKDHIGHLEIKDSTLLFTSTEDDKKNITIPFAQILSVKTSIRVYGYRSIWGYYLRIIYKLTEDSSERRINFMLQKGAGVYGEEIKSAINNFIKDKGAV